MRCRELARATGAESRLYAMLDALDVPYERQFPIKRYLADAFIPATNTVIECYGDYDHCNPTRYPDGPIDKRQRRAIDHDRKREDVIRGMGYRLIALWERDILRMAPDELAGIIA